MNFYDYYGYGYSGNTVQFIPMNNKCNCGDINAETVAELKKQIDNLVKDAPEDLDTFKELADKVDEIVNGKTDNGKIDTFAEVGEALNEVEEKIPEMTALTEEEVIELRKAYQRKESPTKIYKEKYENIMHYNSFLNIWSGRRYALIMPEVFEKGRHTKLNAETVKLIRKDREETNLSYDKLAEKYGISKGTIADIIKKRTWKDV